MTTKTVKYDPFATYEDADIKHLQTIYLNDQKVAFERISKITGYKESTIKNYIRKFAKLLEKAKSLFEEVQKKTMAVITTAKGEIKKKIKPQNFCAYIITYYTSSGERYFLKVGMTSNIERRVSEHITYYKKQTGLTLTPHIEKIFWVDNDDDAMTMENTLRKHYKAKENCGFIARDRFLNCIYEANDIENDEKINGMYHFLGYAN